MATFWRATTATSYRFHVSGNNIPVAAARAQRWLDKKFKKTSPARRQIIKLEFVGRTVR